MIINSEERREKLLEKGVPKGFLDALDEPSKYPSFEFIAKYPEGFYFYGPSIASKYDCLKGYDILPICEGCNSDIYYICLISGSSFRVVHFELENDQIYDDYGQNFGALICDFLIQYYELADDLPVEVLAEVGVKLGFKEATLLFDALEQLEGAELEARINALKRGAS